MLCFRIESNQKALIMEVNNFTACFEFFTIHKTVSNNISLLTSESFE